MAKIKSKKLRNRSKSAVSSASEASKPSSASAQVKENDINSILQQLHETSVDADVDTRSVVSSKSLHGLNLKKKEKRKLRHTVWTKKVGAIEAQIKEAKLRKKRAETAVVGDMSAMLESLPTFDLVLDRVSLQSRLNQHRSKKQKRKERSVETERFRTQQRLADISLFKSIVVHPTFKSSSLSTIVEHLRARLNTDDSL